MAAKEKINKIEKFLRGEKGQRFFNFAYSIGAAIVIWGALFKILHLPGGSALLCIGMGTEIAMFIITAFDRPAKEYAWEQVFPELDRKRHEEGAEPLEGEEDGELPEGASRAAAMQGGGFYGGGGVVISGGGAAGSGEAVAFEGGAPAAGGALPGGVIVAGGGGAIAPGLDITEEDTDSIHSSIEKMAAAAQRFVDIADQMERLQETTSELNRVSGILLDSYKAITDNSATISESSAGYVESMADLNRNISGLNTIYEIQLKSISSQLESIDRVNRGLKDIRDMYEKSARQSSRYCEETERMTRYMTQLNSVYEKMVTAMTINMYNPMMGQPRQEGEFNPYAGRDNGQAEQQKEN